MKSYGSLVQITQIKCDLKKNETTSFPFCRFSSSSLSCGWQTVDQFIWDSDLPLGPLTKFYLALFFSADNYLIILSKAFSLTRKRVCSLQCNHSLVRLLTPNNHILPSHLRLRSLFIASYDSQGLRWKYSNPPPHGRIFFALLLHRLVLRQVNQTENSLSHVIYDTGP
jgi:hypothetical protein